jgi:hypothetical protein
MAKAERRNITTEGGANALPVSPVKSTQTRRGILRALAAAPVVALVPAVAGAAIMPSSSGSDAFAALGAQLQERWAAHASTRPLYEDAFNRAKSTAESVLQCV